MKYPFGLNMFLGLFFVCTQTLYGKPGGQPRHLGFVLAVCDGAGLDAKALAAARQHTLAIFSNAGVEVHWIDLDRKSKCPLPTQAREYFVVAILPKTPNGWVLPDVMGFAPSQTGSYPRAYILYDRVRLMVNLVERTERRESAMGIALGHAIAHELGHLLMPGDVHSLTGIMSTNWHYQHWEDVVTGTLLFNKQQIEVIERRLQGK